MLHTQNEIQIKAPPGVVFDLAADVERWPHFLKHYRYVRPRKGDSRDAPPPLEMSALRSRIPVTWTSTQTLRKDRLEILYHHIAGVTTGMDVIWRIEAGDESVRVTIVHDLDSRRWWVRNLLGRYLVGKIFVENIASKTLQGIRDHAEKNEGRNRGWTSDES